MEDKSLQRTALLVTTLDSFLTPMMASAVAIALPAIARDFAMNAVQLGWVASAYLLAAAAFLLPFGRLADIIGRKKVFTIGTLLFGAASLLAGLAPNAGVFLLRPRAAGDGRGHDLRHQRGHPDLGLPAAAARLGPGHQRGRDLLRAVAGALHRRPADPALWAGARCSWSTCPLGLLVLAAVWLKMRQEWAECRGEPFDWTGLARLQPDADRLHARLHLAAGLARGGDAAAAAAAVLPFFLRWESRSTHTRYSRRGWSAATPFSPSPTWRRWSTTAPPLPSASC